jgi:hypothetical protein
MIRVVHPGSRIRMLTFYPSRIPDPGVKKAPDPGSGTLKTGEATIYFFRENTTCVPVGAGPESVAEKTILRLRNNTLASNDVSESLPQGVTKVCLLSWRTNSALVYEPKFGGGGSCGVSANEYRTCLLSRQTNSALVLYMSQNAGGGKGVAGPQPMSTAVHMEPK